MHFLFRGRVIRIYLLAFFLWDRSGLAQSTGVEVLLQQAREAARTDQNQRSAELFAEIIRRDPSRRQQVLREYADQLTFSGRAVDAIPLFRELLDREELPRDEKRRARRGLALALSWTGQHQAALMEYEHLLAQDLGDVDARIGRARVLSWMGHHAAAQHQYEMVLRQQPDHGEALLGLARVLSWRGRQRQASEILQKLLARDATDREARFLLAESQHFLGREDRAFAELQRLIKQAAPGERERTLERDIRARRRPETVLAATRSEQSDEVDISRIGLEHENRLLDGRGALLLLGSTTTFEVERGDSVRVRRPGIGFRNRFSDSVELNLRIFQDQISSDSGGDHEPTTYDAWLTLWPNDCVRADFDSHRITLDNIPSLLLGITVSSVGGSFDFLPTERLRLTARANAADYSDGNERRTVETELEGKVSPRRTLLLGLRAHGFEFERLLDHGYFNPQEYFSFSTTGRARGLLKERWWTEADGSLGREWVDPGSSKWIYSIRVRLEYRLREDSYVDLRLESFTSRFDSPSGFSRQTLGLSFRHLW